MQSTMMKVANRQAGLGSLSCRRQLSVRVLAGPRTQVTERPVKVAQKVGRSVRDSVKPASPDSPLVAKKGQFTLGFTKSNELFLGRAAMLGFAFSLIGEILTGKGALGQIGYELFDEKLNIVQIDFLVVGLAAFNLIAAFLPTSGTFVPDEEEERENKRGPGPTQNPRISVVTEPKKFLGIKDWGLSPFGFTKENEIFVGRVAQLGFAASLIGETITGKGPLTQFDIETGLSLRDTEFGLLVFIAFFLFAAINPGKGKFVDELKKDRDY